MKNRVRIRPSVWLLIWLLTISHIGALAQTRPAESVSATANLSGEPFKIGENLTYEVSFSRFVLRGIDVADMTFSVAGDDENNQNNLVLKAQAVSKGGLLKIFSYSFLQKFDCTVQTRDEFKVLQTVRYDEQDKRIRNGKADFDYARQKLTYREIDPNNPLAPPRMIVSALDGAVQDLISAVYYLRRQPLAIGKSLTVRLSDSGVVYQVPISITARERINTVIGKVWTLRVEPQIFGDKRPLAGDGKMIMWLTDDQRHLPVRTQIQAKVGKIEIKLKRAENLQPVK